MIWAYVAIALLTFGMTIHDCENVGMTGESFLYSCFVSILWPVTWLVVFGVVIGKKCMEGAK